MINDSNKYNELQHDCELQIDDDIMYNYINKGLFVRCRRQFRKACLINENHPKSKMFFRSLYVIRLEMRKHLREHYYIIHPFSKVNLIREKIMILVYIFVYLAAPFFIMLNEPIINTVKWIPDVICIIDFLLVMNTGYMIETSNKIVLSRKDIFKCKFLSAFFFDFLSSIHIDEMNLGIIPPEIARLNLVLKYFRFLTLFSYLNHYFEDTRLSFKTVTLLKLILLAVIINIWCSIAIYLCDQLSPHPEFTNSVDGIKLVLLCYQEALYFLLLFGSKHVDSYRFIIVQIVIINVGVIFHMIVISQLVQIFRVTGSKNTYYKISQQLEEFMRFRNLPIGIRKRIRTFFNFRFQEDTYKENAIMEMISPQLHQEMLLHTHVSLMENSTIFYDLPTHIMGKLVQFLKPEIYLASDVIVTAGTTGDTMFFIQSGTVAVYTPAGKELCHLSDGSSFGELSMVLEHELRIANVVAIDNCDVFLLHRKDFLRELEGYPDIYERIRLLVQDKIRRTLDGSLQGDGSSEQISDHSMRSRVISSGYIRV